jgi:hypothetical protein
MKADENHAFLKQRKAQVISNDLVVAVLIILIIVGALSAILFEYLSFEEQRAENRDLELKGQEAISTLTGTSGNPTNWHNLV